MIANYRMGALQTALRIVTVAAVAIIGVHAAKAASALAVGVTGDPNDGIAFGLAYNHDTVENAQAAALKECQEFKGALKAAKTCRLIGSIQKGCVSIAFDPKSDSPGMGWAVANDRNSAERQAIDACRATAPADRQQFCKVDDTACDGDTSK